MLHFCYNSTALGGVLLRKRLSRKQDGSSLKIQREKERKGGKKETGEEKSRRKDATSRYEKLSVHTRTSFVVPERFFSVASFPLSGMHRLSHLSNLLFFVTSHSSRFVVGVDLLWILLDDKLCGWHREKFHWLVRGDDADDDVCSIRSDYCHIRKKKNQNNNPEHKKKHRRGLKLFPVNMWGNRQNVSQFPVYWVKTVSIVAPGLVADLHFENSTNYQLHRSKLK